MNITSFTVTVGRTIQERAYEPYNISVSANISVASGGDVMGCMEAAKEYLEKFVDNACQKRREAVTEPAKY